MTQDDEGLRIDYIKADQVVIVKNNLGQINLRPRPLSPPDKELERLLEISQRRCARYWQAAGVAPAHAAALSKSLSLGAIGGNVLPLPKRPVVLLRGEIGSGKSLTAERIFRNAVDLALSDRSAPLSVFLGPPWNNNPVALRLRDLRVEVADATSTLGDVTRLGTTVVIDGVDPLGGAAVLDLIDQAHLLVRDWPNTTALITCRPIPAIRDEQDIIVDLPELTEQERTELLERFAPGALTPRDLLALPPSLHQALRRPLFAVLYGVQRWAYRSHGTPQSIGELLSTLVETSLASSGPLLESARVLMRRLGARSVDLGGAVSPNEVRTAGALEALLESGLVLDPGRDGGLEFSLPILAEYFAATSLEAGEVDLDELIKDRLRLERWRFALAMFLANADWERSVRGFGPIVREHPAVATDLLRLSLPSRRSHFTQLPTSLECGRQIHGAMEAWVQGIGPALAQVVAPVATDGKLPPLGILVHHGDCLITAWEPGERRNVQDVVELPLGIQQPPIRTEALRHWKTLHYSVGVGGHPIWAWQWTLDQLSASLKESFEYRELPIWAGPLFEERAWIQIRALLGYERSRRLADVRVRLEQLIADHDAKGFDPETNYSINSVRMRIADMHRLHEYVLNLLERGHESLRPLLPGPDLAPAGNWVWSGYSVERTLERARAVFAAALDGYRLLVDAVFPSLAPRLATYVILPARVIARLRAGSPESRADIHPQIEWIVQAEPSGGPSVIDVEAGALNIDFDVLEGAYRQILLEREEMAGWLRHIHNGGGLEVFGEAPVTELAYRLLGDDLYYAGWLDERPSVGPKRRWP